MLFIEQMGVAGAVTSSRIMMLSLDITDEMIPVPLPITISTEARAVTYNHVEHRVCMTRSLSTLPANVDIPTLPL